MAFPTLAELDAIVIPAMATAAELVAVHRTRDGTETPCVAWLDDVAVESYSESGVTVSSQRREVTIQRAEVSRPVEQDTVTIGSDVWRLHQKLSQDAGQTRWIVVPARGDGT